MGNTYLSVDIDFWNNLGDVDCCTWHDKKENLNIFLEKCYATSTKYAIPLIAVMNHQQLLKFVDNSNANILLNIDEHSDLTRSNVTELNCGTWISYVRWRNIGTYYWMQSNVNPLAGDCSGYDDSNDVIFNHKRINMEQVDWSDLKLITQLSLMTKTSMNAVLSSAISIGIVLSPQYSHPILQQVFRKWVKNYDVPYRRGVLREDRAERRATPPQTY